METYPFPVANGARVESARRMNAGCKSLPRLTSCPIEGLRATRGIRRLDGVKTAGEREVLCAARKRVEVAPGSKYPMNRMLPASMRGGPHKVVRDPVLELKRKQ